MKLETAKEQVLELILRDINNLNLDITLDPKSPDRDEGKFVINEKPARTIAPFDGFFANISLRWFSGSTELPKIKRGEFYYYVFALAGRNKDLIENYFICHYNKLREWVLEFDAPKGSDHMDHHDWRGEIEYLGDPPYSKGYFRWGDEPKGENRKTRYINLNNIREILTENNQIDVNYLILTFKEDSPWEDEYGESYHYGTTVPNHKKIKYGSKFLFFQKNTGFVGSGEIGNIETEDSPPDGPQKFRAKFNWFEAINPPIELNNEIKNAISSVEGYNVQHSIKVIDEEIFDMILNTQISGINYWIYSPGANAKFWDEFYEGGIMSIGSGVDKLGDLRNYVSVEEIKIKIQEEYGEKNPVFKAGMCYAFANTIKPEDVVFVKKGRKEIIGYGTVETDYIYESDQRINPHVRKVRWSKRGSWKLNNHSRLADYSLPIKALSNITRFESLVTDLLELIGLEKKLHNSWIFQGNPKYYDIEGSLKALPRQKWSVRQHKKDIKAGDTVYMWKAGTDASILAIGTILTDPADIPEDEEAKEFVISAEEFKDVETRVVVNIENVLDKPILKDTLINHPILSQLSILKSPQGTNFLLTPEEANALRELIIKEPVVEVYTKTDALKDLFIEEKEFDYIMDRLKTKKNIIIQGPPGVGKTFIAKRLAYYLIKHRDVSRVSMIQFHQSYSYEDFIQGFRPNQDGKFILRDGIFYDFCSRAMNDENKPWVFIIDEINRGNLSKIFGEMLMLIESDKRGPEFAVPLTYGEDSSDTFYIPSNVYLIGTMNTADRSLAMVDYALRRRFSFINLEPQFKSPRFRQFLINAGIKEAMIDLIVERLESLNENITNDNKNLGPGYRIGHSYFCPTNSELEYDERWYQMVIRSEIEPLLQEYWFDDQKRVDDHVGNLLSGI